MKIKIFLSLLIFIFISCNKVENTSESANSFPLIKKSIIVGDVKYDGPEKISYYHAAIRNGNVDINKPSRFREYKSGYRDVEFNKLIRSRNNLLNSRSLTNLEEDNDIRYSNYAEDNAVFIERGPTNGNKFLFILPEPFYKLVMVLREYMDFQMLSQVSYFNLKMELRVWFLI